MKWQPIETAPKDGRQLLILQESRFRPLVVVSWDKVYDMWVEFGNPNPEEPTHWVEYWGDPPYEIETLRTFNDGSVR